MVNDRPSKMLEERQRERDAAVGNLNWLLDNLPMLEMHRGFIKHAIKVIKDGK